MTAEIIVTDQFVACCGALTEAEQESVRRVVRMLEEGDSAGRPPVDEYLRDNAKEFSQGGIARMKTYRWKDLKHKSSPERLAQIDREAVEELNRVGFAALRKAREQTQVELAQKLGVNQASVSGIENNTDLLLSTLDRYIRALGGKVRIQAVFPEATFELNPLLACAPKKRVLGASRVRRTIANKLNGPSKPAARGSAL